MKSPENLETLVRNNHNDYALLLAGGPVFSRKTITISKRKGKKFRVINHIDDTIQHLTTKELSTKSNINEGITKNAFICVK